MNDAHPQTDRPPLLRERLLSTLLFCAPRMAFSRAARRRLRACLPNTWKEIWRDAVRLQAALLPSRPRHSAGVDLVVRYLEWDLALYRALQAHGWSRERAGALIEEIGWDIFGPVTAASFRLTRLRSSRLETRVRWLLDLMFRLVFSSPFRRRSLASSDGVAFDVTVCPLAAYMAAQGLPELTRHAACNLDHRMARDWGMSLTRSRTIADGATYCDFRFRIAARDSAGPALNEDRVSAQP